jgi:uncharacterized protein
MGMGGDRRLLNRCREIVKGLHPSADLILYGSRARGDAATDSDYDLLILIDGEADLKKEDDFRRALFPLQLEFDAVLTVFLYNRQTWDSALYRAMPFNQNVRREGILL